MQILHLYIKATLNNITINLTTITGDSIYSISTGHLNFSKSKRVLSFAAKTCMIKIINKIRKLENITQIYVFVKGVARARTIALKELGKTQLPIKIIKEITPLAHNGCRGKKLKRI